MSEFWSAADCIEALHAWVRKHGRVPTTAHWRAVGYDHPCAQTVIERFGTWNVALACAGYPTRRTGPSPLIGEAA